MMAGVDNKLPRAERRKLARALAAREYRANHQEVSK